MTADILHPDFNPAPSAKEANDAPLENMRALMANAERLQAEVAVSHIRWWNGWAREWERFFLIWWKR